MSVATRNRRATDHADLPGEPPTPDGSEGVAVVDGPSPNMVHSMLTMTCEFIEPFIEHQGERRFFWLRRPRVIGEKILIARKGLTVRDPHENRTVLYLDFKSAFGTGGHGTTEGCLIALEEFIKGGEAVLDVGTGTGILAIAARKLGAGRITAVDIDRASCVEAGRNLALNGLEDGIEVIEGGIDSAKARFDVIAANLRTHILVALMGELVAKLDEGGLAIFSGILERELLPFLALVERYPLNVVEIKRIHGWMTVVSKKSGSSPGTP